MASRPTIAFSSEEAIGGLSYTSKMPGPSYSLSAHRCKTGAKLAQDPKSPCASCYAMRGRYVFPNVVNAHERRYAALSRPDWLHHMVRAIENACEQTVPYFRWFDSGDVQSVQMMNNIISIAQELPHIRFWLPTQEWEFLDRTYFIPRNLVIRLSCRKRGINVTRPNWPTTSSVAHFSKPKLEQATQNQSADAWVCPAKLQSNTCGACRACWKPSIKHIIYPQH